jgi:hypothetical protein
MAMYADQLTNAPKSNFLTGSKGGFQNVPIFNQQQSGAFQNILNQGMGLLNDPYNSPIAQRAIQRFHSQTLPSIAERFTAMGGGQRSSAFSGEVGAAGSQLEQDIAAQGFQNALPLLQLGLTPQYQTAHIPGHQGFLHGIAGPALQAILAGVTGGVGGAVTGLGGMKGAGAGLLSFAGGLGQNGQGGQGGGIADIIKLLMGGG